MLDTKTRITAGARFIVILIGLIGNTITFIVYSRPVFAKNSISVYCRALAVLECYIIVDLAYEYGMAFFNDFLGNSSELSCIIFYYFGNTFGSIPGWILIAFSIDKVLSMRNIGISIIKKRSFQYIVIASIVLSNLVLYIEIPIYLRRVNGTNTTYLNCDTSLPFYTVVSGINLVEGSILPFLIMITTSIISIRLIRNSSKNVSSQLVMGNTRFKRNMKFAITSISFNFMFIFLKLPIVVLAVLLGFISSLTVTSLEVELAYLLYFMNNSIGLVVHLVSNNIFRREFFQLFSFQKQDMNQSSFQSSILRKRRHAL